MSGGGFQDHWFPGLIALGRVPMRQGKVREKWNFAKVREMSGNFDECQGNLKNKAWEMSDKN